MSKAVITNALLRVTREDQLAEGVFELVRGDLGLWVLELPQSLEAIAEDLSEIRPLLRMLSKDASDYTLHLAAAIDEVHSLVIPSVVAELSFACGFSIEVSGSAE
ncbi:MAG: hypothetical protein MI807_08430 [Verrucomicrobiales bacterium]|nr:hypothetical protein [Verrucomicrobiales bacterium]